MDKNQEKSQYKFKIEINIIMVFFILFITVYTPLPLLEKL